MTHQQQKTLRICIVVCPAILIFVGFNLAQFLVPDQYIYLYLVEHMTMHACAHTQKKGDFHSQLVEYSIVFPVIHLIEIGNNVSRLLVIIKVFALTTYKPFFYFFCLFFYGISDGLYKKNKKRKVTFFDGCMPENLNETKLTYSLKI